MEIGGKRTLTKGKKKGEMVYTRPDYITGKKRVQVKSDVKGGRGKINPPRVKPTASKGQIHSAANKEKIDKAARAANKRSAKANRDTIKKNETIGQQRKRKAENKAIDKGFKTIALKKGKSINKAINNKKVSKTAAQDMEDAYQMESGYDSAMMGEYLLTPENRKKLEMIREIFPESPGKQAGRKLYKQRKNQNREAQTNNEKLLKTGLKVIAQKRKNNKKPKTSPEYTKGLPDREMEIKMGVPNQKYMDATSTDAEGPKKKKMGGGQVYKRSKGGKVIKSNMSGQDLVNACYDN